MSDAPKATFCCQMRARFIVGLLAEDTRFPVPTDAADFIDFSESSPSGKPVIRIRFCPFCAAKIDGQPVRVTAVDHE